MLVGIFAIYVAELIEGPYVEIEKNLYIPHGKERVVKMGSLPARYIKFIMTKGSPVMDISKIKLFGLAYSDIKAKFDKSLEDIIYKFPMDVMYGKAF